MHHLLSCDLTVKQMLKKKKKTEDNNKKKNRKCIARTKSNFVILYTDKKKQKAGGLGRLSQHGVSIVQRELEERF